MPVLDEAGLQRSSRTRCNASKDAHEKDHQSRISRRRPRHAASCPSTKASPKEMLPVVDKPLIQYAVEEAAAAGITDMIFITGRNKRAIEDHFDKAYELETELALRNKTALLEQVQAATPPRHQLHLHPPDRGAGPRPRRAVRRARRRRRAVRRAARRRPDRRERAGDEADGRRRRTRERVGDRRDGRAGGGHRQLRHRRDRREPAGERVGRITRIVEKPKPGHVAVDAGRRRPLRAVAAHLPPPAHDAGRRRRRDPAHRRHRTPAAGRARAGVRFDGRRYDCGSKLGYLEATVDFGFKHAEVGAASPGFSRSASCADRAACAADAGHDDAERASLHRRRRAGAQLRPRGGEVLRQPAGAVGRDPEARGGAGRAAVRARQERRSRSRRSASGSSSRRRRCWRRPRASARSRSRRPQPARRHAAARRHLHGRAVSAAGPDPGAARRWRRRCRSTSRRTSPRTSRRGLEAGPHRRRDHRAAVRAARRRDRVPVRGAVPGRRAAGPQVGEAQVGVARRARGRAHDPAQRRPLLSRPGARRVPRAEPRGRAGDAHQLARDGAQHGGVGTRRLGAAARRADAAGTTASSSCRCRSRSRCRRAASRSPTAGAFRGRRRSPPSATAVAACRSAGRRAPAKLA